MEDQLKMYRKYIIAVPSVKLLKPFPQCPDMNYLHHKLERFDFINNTDILIAMIYLSLPFSLNTTDPGFIYETVRLFRGMVLGFFITRITSHVFCKVRHIRFVLVGIYI